jgi:hypothetical protein
MAEDEVKKACEPDKVTAQNMHNTLLEALRHREQEILRYIAILAPALGGFVWLVKEFIKDNEVIGFTIGTVGVLFLLLLGAIYSLALGYNYRCITMQIAKLEALCLGMCKFILESWPRTPQDFVKYKWCYPPEIIKPFWLAFVICIFGVTGIALLLLPIKENRLMWGIILVFGIICFCIALLAPSYYGSKFENHRKKE